MIVVHIPRDNLIMTGRARGHRSAMESERVNGGRWERREYVVDETGNVLLLLVLSGPRNEIVGGGLVGPEKHTPLPLELR